MNLIYIYAVVFSMMELYKEAKVIGVFLKHSEACQELIESFASASARFMFCTLQNARPVHICCSCVRDYNNVLEEHTKITRLNSSCWNQTFSSAIYSCLKLIKKMFENNSSCNEKLVNQDRLEVIENGFSYITDLWMRGQCRNCFENKTELSNTTKLFINLYSDINDCIESQYYPTHKSYNPNVCHICSKKYYKMSDFYAKLKETTGNGNVCMDIVDSVNVTQHLWSNVLHCGETVMTIEIPLIATSTAFILISIVFYICAWKFTKDRSSVVLNQNRISQRFQERWRSRTGSSVSS